MHHKALETRTIKVPRRPLVDRRDLGIVLLFALFAVFFFLDRFRGAHPFIFLEGDAANIASFAAAIDHPDLFAGDEVLGNYEHFRFYRTIHIPLLRGLAPLLGGYGTAFVALLPWHVLLQSLGFYVLGRALFASRYWAALLALVNLAPVWVGLGTYWGIYVDPQPRFSFQALLPFLLAAALRWRDAPRRWPWIMVGIALLMYVHPVSTPGWAFALWLGVFFARERPFRSPRHVAYLIVLGFLFLLLSAPFLVSYLGDHAHGEAAGEDYERVRSLFQEMFGAEFLDAPNALRRFLLRWSWGERLYWAAAACGAVFLAWKSPHDRKRLRTVLTWGIGLAVVAVVIPSVEHEVCRRLGILPVEFDLVRGLRYFVPLMLLFCLWPLAAAERLAGSEGFHRQVPRIVGALLVGVWLFWHPPLRLAPWMDCWRAGELVCQPAGWDERMEAVGAVRRKVAPGEAILARDLHLELRYGALRPVVYAFKDRGMLSYTDPKALLRWDDLRQELAAVDALPVPEERFAALSRLALRLGANHLLLRAEDVPAEPSERGGWELVWQGDELALASRR